MAAMDAAGGVKIVESFACLRWSEATGLGYLLNGGLAKDGDAEKDSVELTVDLKRWSHGHILRR